MASVFSPLLRAPEGRHRLTIERTGDVIADRLVPAFDSKARKTGLLAHDVFPPGSAMLIAPTNAIHTFFMKFPIDVLFVAKDGRIVKLRHAIPPWRMVGAFGAYGVIELPAGTLGIRVQPTDRVVIAADIHSRESPLRPI